MGLAEVMGVSMSKLWDKAVEYYLTHDGIEMFLLACMWGSLGWIAYHAIAGIIERIMG